MVESDTFTIQVTDHGESIPKEQLPYIFERFYKSSSGNNKNGSGLGLAIAGEIAKRHGRGSRCKVMIVLRYLQ